MLVTGVIFTVTVTFIFMVLVVTMVVEVSFPTSSSRNPTNYESKPPQH